MAYRERFAHIQDHVKRRSPGAQQDMAGVGEFGPGETIADEGSQNGGGVDDIPAFNETDVGVGVHAQ